MNQKLLNLTLENNEGNLFLDYQREDSTVTTISISMLEENKIEIEIYTDRDSSADMKLELVGDVINLLQEGKEPVKVRKVKYGVGYDVGGRSDEVLQSTYITDYFDTLEKALNSPPKRNGVVVEFGVDVNLTLFIAKQMATDLFVWERTDVFSPIPQPTYYIVKFSGVVEVRKSNTFYSLREALKTFPAEGLTIVRFSAGDGERTLIRKAIEVLPEAPFGPSEWEWREVAINNNIEETISAEKEIRYVVGEVAVNNNVEKPTSAEREIMYGVGIEKQEGEIGMTHGPFKTLKEATGEFPCQGGVIVKFDEKEDIILFRAQLVLDEVDRVHDYIWQEV
jgi:hypothetical protein